MRLNKKAALGTLVAAVTTGVVAAFAKLFGIEVQ